MMTLATTVYRTTAELEDFCLEYTACSDALELAKQLESRIGVNAISTQVFELHMRLANDPDE